MLEHGDCKTVDRAEHNPGMGFNKRKMEDARKPRFYEPDLIVDPNSPFARDASNELWCTTAGPLGQFN